MNYPDLQHDILEVFAEAQTLGRDFIVGVHIYDRRASANRMAVWRAAHPLRAREHARASATPEKRARDREWKRANKERHAEHSRRWREKQREKKCKK